MTTEEPPWVIRSHIRIFSAGQHPDSWGTPGCNPDAYFMSDSVVRAARIPR